MRFLRSLPEFSEGQRIGLFGGSFNPAHEGHRAAALAALKAAKLEWIWWLVSPQNPLKDPGETGDLAERVERTRELARHPRFVVTALEKDLATTITAETLERLKPVLARGRFVWIMGADSFATLHRWKHWQEIPRALPILVIARPRWTMRALSSLAAYRMCKFRLPQESVSLLPDCRPPAWTYLAVPLRHESSSAIRHGIAKENHLNCLG